MRGLKKMNKNKCSGNCFDDFLNDYDENDDNYTVQRLKDIIKICEFLIEREENKKGRQILDDMLDAAKEKANQEKDHEEKNRARRPIYRIYPYYYPPGKTWVWPDKNERMPWWDQVWF